jgi:hypothetical protein
VTDNVTGCFSQTGVTIEIYQLPPQPSGSGNEQCGYAIPNCSVSSNSGEPTPYFRWYDAPTGGNLIQEGYSNTYLNYISATTYFYVSEVSPYGCEGSRSGAVVQSVNQPDPIIASASTYTITLGESFDIVSYWTASFNVYSQFTISGSTGSGVDGTQNMIILDPYSYYSTEPYNVIPTVSGIYTYYIIAYDVDQGCAQITSFSVTVNPPTPTPTPTLTQTPTITPTYTQTPTPTNVPLGGAITFTANTNNSLTLAASNDWAVGTGDYTIEWFSYITSFNSSSKIFELGNQAFQINQRSDGSVNNNISLGLNIWTGPGTGNRTQVNYSVSRNTWNYFAISKVSGFVNVYINGQRVYRFADFSNITNNTNTLVIGSAIYGHLTNFRWIKGTGLYNTTTISVPTQPLTALPNTKLLLKATSEGTFLDDSSGTGKIVTNNGTSFINSKPF